MTLDYTGIVEALCIRRVHVLNAPMSTYRGSLSEVWGDHCFQGQCCACGGGEGQGRLYSKLCGIGGTRST